MLEKKILTKSRNKTLCDFIKYSVIIATKNISWFWGCPVGRTRWFFFSFFSSHGITQEWFIIVNVWIAGANKQTVSVAGLEMNSWRQKICWIFQKKNELEHARHNQTIQAVEGSCWGCRRTQRRQARCQLYWGFWMSSTAHHSRLSQLTKGYPHEVP